MIIDHRSELKEVDEIKFIEDVLVNQLGYLSVFYYLNALYRTLEYSGPYLEVAKG
jgi:hypothetical protein